MGQQASDSDPTQPGQPHAPGQPICTHRDSADETHFGHYTPDPNDPTDIGSPTLDVNELHRRANNLEESYYETMERAFANNPEARFTEDEDRNMYYAAKPFYIWIPAGMAAAFLFWLQHYIYLHHEAWGAPFGRLDGLVRLGLMLLGAYLAFIAWPWRRYTGQTPEDFKRQESARYSFIDRFWRKR